VSHRDGAQPLRPQLENTSARPGEAGWAARAAAVSRRYNDNPRAALYF
jgi:hypothetical protein